MSEQDMREIVGDGYMLLAIMAEQGHRYGVSVALRVIDKAERLTFDMMTQPSPKSMPEAVLPPLKPVKPKRDKRGKPGQKPKMVDGYPDSYDRYARQAMDTVGCPKCDSPVDMPCVLVASTQHGKAGDLSRGVHKERRAIASVDLPRAK